MSSRDRASAQREGGTGIRDRAAGAAFLCLRKGVVPWRDEQDHADELMRALLGRRPVGRLFQQGLDLTDQEG